MLKELEHLGYEELGDEYMSGLIRGLYAKDGHQGIFDRGIRVTETYERREQLKVLRHLTDSLREQSGKGRKETMQEIRKGLESSEDMRRIWRDPERLGEWISGVVGEKNQ